MCDHQYPSSRILRFQKKICCGQDKIQWQKEQQTKQMCKIKSIKLCTLHKYNTSAYAVPKICIRHDCDYIFQFTKVGTLECIRSTINDQPLNIDDRNRSEMCKIPIKRIREDAKMKALCCFTWHMNSICNAVSQVKAAKLFIACILSLVSLSLLHLNRFHGDCVLHFIWT